MTRTEQLIDGVDYHQFYLCLDASNTAPEYPTEPSDPARLVAATDDAHSACVTTGIATGTINLAFELLPSPPTHLDSTRNWEVIAEVSLEATATIAKVLFLQTYPAAVPPGLETINLPTGHGWYRVRAHATGRALDFDATVTPHSQEQSQPREFHLLQLWPTPEPGKPSRLRDDNPWANQ